MLNHNQRKFSAMTGAKKFQLSLLILLLISAIALIGPTANSQSQLVSSSYLSETPIQRSTIVQLVDDGSLSVKPASISSQNLIVGVTVDRGDMPIALYSGDGNTLVASSGQRSVLVNDQEGPINPGDYIAVSSVDGIGRKAIYQDEVVVARALTGFNDNSSIISTVELMDEDGGEPRSLNIGRIVAEVNIIPNPIIDTSVISPFFFQSIIDNLPGTKEAAEPIRYYAASAIFLAGSILAIAVTVSGIRSSIISIGRNPLSKTSVYRSLARVLFFGLLVFLIASFGVYLILVV
jgi:hypothetical protein